jgi:hypothetical protein
MKARNAGTPQPAPWPTTIRSDAKRQRHGPRGREVVPTGAASRCTVRSNEQRAAPGRFWKVGDLHQVKVGDLHQVKVS